MLLSLTYLSSARHLLSRDDLRDLLETIRPRNAERGLTGMLLYADGNIIQVLEGPKAVVERTFADIEADDRHHDVTVLLREEVVERAFVDWSMGFRDVTAAVEGPEGYTTFLRDHGDDLGEAAPRAYRMLELFRDSMR